MIRFHCKLLFFVLFYFVFRFWIQLFFCSFLDGFNLQFLSAGVVNEVIIHNFRLTSRIRRRRNTTFKRHFSGKLRASKDVTLQPSLHDKLSNSRFDACVFEVQLQFCYDPSFVLILWQLVYTFHVLILLRCFPLLYFCFCF